jgi:hypothetical protein
VLLVGVGGGGEGGGGDNGVVVGWEGPRERGMGGDVRSGDGIGGVELARDVLDAEPDVGGENELCELAEEGGAVEEV